VAKGHWGRRRQNLQRSLASRSSKLQAWGLPVESGQWPDSADDASFTSSELESNGTSDSSRIPDTISDSDSFTKGLEFEDFPSNYKLLQEDQSRLDKMSIEINLLKFEPNRYNLRKFAKKGQWPSKVKIPKGEYTVPVNRDSFRHVTYLSGMIRSLQDIVSALRFGTDSSGIDLENFLRKFLKNIPRKYFFTSSDCKSLRAQVFWTHRLIAERKKSTH